MADDIQAGLCPDDRLMAGVEAARDGDETGLAHIEALIGEYPSDPRLHFMRGSMLAGLKRYGEAHEAMGRAIDIAPGFAVARFQLGLLQLSSGDAVAAETTWAPLHALPEESSLRLFVVGLGHLIRDEFEATITTLEQGIALNTENPPMNRDMRLIIDGAREKLGSSGDGDEATSSAHLLLQQYELKNTRH